MAHYIDKDAVILEIERVSDNAEEVNNTAYVLLCNHLKDFIDTLEVKDPYEQCVQYDSIKAGIQAHAETYSFNIESELFNQLTKEQQALWRKEIEQACISGGYSGIELAKDPRYKENLEVKVADLDEALSDLDKDIKEKESKFDALTVIDNLLDTLEVKSEEIDLNNSKDRVIY